MVRAPTLRFLLGIVRPNHQALTFAHRKSKTPGQASQGDLSPMSPGILEGPLIKHARNPDQKFLGAPSGFHQLNLGLKLKSLKPSWLMIIDIIGDCTTQCIADDHSV